MNYFKFFRQCLVIASLAAALFTGALTSCEATAAVHGTNEISVPSAKTSDPVFNVPTFSNPIQAEDVKDAAIAEQKDHWLVSGKVLEKYGIRESPKKPGFYQMRLPDAPDGTVSWQNKNVELLLPGVESKNGYMVSIRNIRRPLGISYILHSSNVKELLLPMTPVQTIPELKGQILPEAGNKKAKMDTVILWDPQMKDDAFIPMIKAKQPVISPCVFSLSKDGLILKHPDFDTYVEKYHARGYTVWPLIDNQFDPKMTHSILMDKRLQEQIAGEMIGYAKLYGLAGYNIDFENVNYTDKDKLTDFVKMIAERGKAYGLALSMDITAHSDSLNWSKVYDRPALSQVLDYLVLMAYDEYGRGSSVAGPNDSYNWVDMGIKNLAAEVEPQKIVLAMPLYMRRWHEENGKGKLTDNMDDWKIDEKHESGTEKNNNAKVKNDDKPDLSEGAKQKKYKHLSVSTLSMADSRAYFHRFSKYIEWNDTLKIHYMELPLTTGLLKVWLEDEKSLGYKMDLFRKYKLGGIAFWRKDFEDDEFWKTFGKRELT